MQVLGFGILPQEEGLAVRARNMFRENLDGFGRHTLLMQCSFGLLLIGNIPLLLTHPSALLIIVGENDLWRSSLKIKLRGSPRPFLENRRSGHHHDGISVGQRRVYD